LYCGKSVNSLGYTSRDHCPYCLHSIHIDINPGDRKNTCLGDLEPIDIEKYRDSYKIVYKCKKCGITHKNIMANDDDFEKIIKLSVK
jgi:DNA-directed RNA polymerase subunit RPC12/RpoP